MDDSLESVFDFENFLEERLKDIDVLFVPPSPLDSTESLKLEEMDSKLKSTATQQLYGVCQEQNEQISRLYDEAITVNKEYAAALQSCLEELNERKLLVEKRQRILKEEIKLLKTNHTGRKTVKQVMKLSFSQFGYPYFKDKDGKALPVYEEALGLNKALHFEPIYDFPKLLKTPVKQKAKKEAVGHSSRAKPLKTLLKQKAKEEAVVHSSREKAVAAKRVATKPRGRPMRRETALDTKIAERLATFKSIRRGRPRTTSLPGDGRRNGMILNAIQRLLPLKTDQGNVPRDASELVAAGIAKKDAGAVEVMLSLPGSSLNSKVRFPANLAFLTGLRGLLLTEDEVSPVEVGIEQGIPLTEVNELCCFGDALEDEKLLLVFEKCFGWARPLFYTEAPVDGTKMDGPPF